MNDKEYILEKYERHSSEFEVFQNEEGGNVLFEITDIDDHYTSYVMGKEQMVELIATLNKALEKM